MATSEVWIGGAQRDAVVSGCLIEYIDGQRHVWSVYFRKTDVGRSTLRRPKQQNDCTVRAIAAVYDIPYDGAYDMLASAGRKSWQGFPFHSWAKEEEGLKWRPFQPIKGQTRMNPAKFCTMFPTGKWIIRTAKHVCAVIDGVVWDTESPNPERCIYGAWEVL